MGNEWRSGYRQMSGRLAVCYAETLLRQLKFTTGRDVETGGIRNRAAVGLSQNQPFTNCGFRVAVRAANRPTISLVVSRSALAHPRDSPVRIFGAADPLAIFSRDRVLFRSLFLIRGFVSGTARQSADTLRFGDDDDRAENEHAEDGGRDKPGTPFLCEASARREHGVIVASLNVPLGGKRFDADSR